MNQLKLTLDEIENKMFNIDFKGYSSYEVDSYLDMIMEDYQTMQDTIAELEVKCDHYQNIIDQLSLENQHLKTKVSSITNETNPSVSPSMVDIIRRISRLEEIVFKNNQ